MLSWPAALLSPILFIQLSAGLPRSPPSLAFALRTIAGIAACVVVGWLITFVVAFPSVCVLLIGLLLFAAFWAQAGGRAGLAPFVLMIAVCVLPVLAIEAPEVATLIAAELVRASAVAFLLIWGTWALFPDPHTPATAAEFRKTPPASATSSPAIGARNRARIALSNTLVVMPVGAGISGVRAQQCRHSADHYAWDSACADARCPAGHRRWAPEGESCGRSSFKKGVLI